MGNASSIFYMVLGLRALEYKELPEVEELFIDKNKIGWVPNARIFSKTRACAL